MSPMRIGSIVLIVLTIRPTLNLSPTKVSSIVPLGFSVGMPGDCGVEDRQLHLGPRPHAARQVDADLPRS